MTTQRKIAEVGVSELLSMYKSSIGGTKLLVVACFQGRVFSQDTVNELRSCLENRRSSKGSQAGTLHLSEPFTRILDFLRVAPKEMSMYEQVITEILPYGKNSYSSDDIMKILEMIPEKHKDRYFYFLMNLVKEKHRGGET